ncbi:MAG: class I SAM-dependent methyltransferase [Eubacteriales bacterium]|nr:class I SAM-dependent methyltransferase [Eubacteriales bacterium]
MGVQLSRRMSALAALVTEGNRLADVGTDHGYVPIALVQSGRIPSAIAMDVAEGPLGRAREHIREQGLDTYIETRQSDGLSRLRPGEADTVLIAGMGGMLMLRILKAAEGRLMGVRELILQPQSEIHLVRRYLRAGGFSIAAEDVVEEDGKYYPMFRAETKERAGGSAAGHCADAAGAPVNGPETEAFASGGADWELYYGNVGIQRSPGVLMEYLLREEQKNEAIRRQLEERGRSVQSRMEELLQERERIQSALRAVRRVWEEA